LPKTRSGKILRGTERLFADGESYKVPSTIDDPAILPEVEEPVKTIGYGRRRNPARIVAEHWPVPETASIPAAASCPFRVTPSGCGTL